MSHGTALASSLSTLLEAWRPARPLAIGGEGRERLFPAVGQLALLDLHQLGGFLGVLGFVLVVLLHPRAAQLAAALADAVLEVSRTPSGTWNFSSGGQAVELLGAGDFLVAERRAVGGVRALLASGRRRRCGCRR